jgi:short-subunit dehydrogenase
MPNTMTNQEKGKNNNKVALVTGASSGIGKAIAMALLKNGFTVIGAARSVDKMADLKAQGAYLLYLDIAHGDSIQAVVDNVLGIYGRVDVLVNNAGFGCYGTVEETDIDAARYQFEVNLFGLARLTQLLLPQMRQLGGGKIVNVSSMGGKIYTALGSWYHASKHALEGWSDCLRLELAAFNIDVIIIEPGIIQTEFESVIMAPMLERSGHGAYAPLTNKVAKGIAQMYSNGKATSPAVIAEVVLKAVTAKRPKTRYVAGYLAKPLLWVRKWLGDRAFDWAVLTAAK